MTRILTEEEKIEIYKEMKTKEALKNKEVFEKREAYKDIIDESVEESFLELEEISEMMATAKARIYERFDTALEMKSEIYGAKESQQSHTFTSRSGKTIVLGNRVRDSFDDTVHAGIEKIKNWVYGVADGEKREEQIALLDILLKRDRNGNLDAKRVLELRQMAEKINNEEFLDGVKIIESSYKAVKSSTFLEAYKKNDKNQRENLPLSMTSV